MNVLYFPDLPELEEKCGYGEYLKRIFSDGRVRVKKYNFDKHPSELILENAVSASAPDLVIGNGFGALPALIFLRLKNFVIPAILINPMYPLIKYLQTAQDLTGEYVSFLDDYTFCALCARDKDEIFKNVFVIGGESDDIIDTGIIKDYFLGDHVFLADGGHFLKEGVLADAIHEIMPYIKGREKTETAPRRIHIYDDLNAFDTLREYLINENSNKETFYAYAFSKKNGELNEVVKSVAQSIITDGKYKNIRIEDLSADELPPLNDKLRDRFKDADALIIRNVRKNLITADIENSLFVICDELLSRGGKVVLLADSVPHNVFSPQADVLDFIYDGEVFEYYFDGRLEDCNAYTFTRKGGVNDAVRPYRDRYMGIHIDDINMENGNFTFYYTSPYTSAGILYLYYKDGCWHALDEKGYAAYPEEISAVLKAAADDIGKNVEKSLDEEIRMYENDEE